MESITIQDHGGNWHKHGSLNADREWSLDYTDAIVYGLRADRLRNKQEKEPRRCPQCAKIVATRRCPCGYEFEGKKASRPVVSADGSLKQMTGDIYKARRVSQRHSDAADWDRMLWRAKSKKWNATFKQAEAMFAYEHDGFWPSHDLPGMPTDPLDFFRRVNDVPMSRLIPKENANA
jgi:hypothetical protein